MKQNERILWAVAIVLVDIGLVALPVTAFVAAYIILARPVWFQEWVNKLYQDF